MQRLRSLVQWLVQRAAPHMARPRLHLSYNYGDSAPGWDDADREWWRQELTTTLVAALAACGAHGRLTDLCLELDVSCGGLHLHLGAWLAPLASLRRLTAMLSEGVVYVTSSLRCLAALQHLCLASLGHGDFHTSVEWLRGSALPASLTSLCLGSARSAGVLPAQVCMHADDPAMPGPGPPVGSSSWPRAACLPACAQPAALPDAADSLPACLAP